MTGEVTVAVNQITTTTSDLGDTTTVTVTTTVAGVLFEPKQSTERTDSRSPGVVTPAKFYGPFPTLDADDTIIHAGFTWQVIGGSAVWGDESEVPVVRASAV